MVEFQPRSVTTPSLVSVAYCYEALILVSPVLTFRRYTSLRCRFRLLPCLPTRPVAPPQGIIYPPGRLPSLSQHTSPASSLRGVLRSPDHFPSLMLLTRLIPYLAVVQSLLIPTPVMPSIFPSPPLPCICQNLF